jgi:hypothetical protein
MAGCTLLSLPKTENPLSCYPAGKGLFYHYQSRSSDWDVILLSCLPIPVLGTVACGFRKSLQRRERGFHHSVTLMKEGSTLPY